MTSNKKIYETGKQIFNSHQEKIKNEDVCELCEMCGEKITLDDIRAYQEEGGGDGIPAWCSECAEKSLIE